jgi:hypothetical protein
MAGTVPAATPSSGADLKEHAAYQHAELNCDVVMKGGITSGVTYPWAVCEIAKTYRLRSIGGTSAGAIAAAAAAAAETGRAVETGGFARLADLPGRLSRVPSGLDTPTLFNVFQPQPGTAAFFGLLTAWLRGKEKGKGRQIRSVIASAVRTFWLPVLVGATFGLVVLALSIALLVSQHGAFAIVALVLAALAGLVLALVGALAGTLAVAARGAIRGITRNRFGLCSGFAPAGEGPAPSDGDLQPGPGGGVMPKPLTTWLADELDALAGRPDPTKPLTLGDLCEAGITLKMFTTNVTEGTPYTIPFQTRRFFFAPSEFEELFPKRVVDWMRAHASAPRDDDERALFAQLAAHEPSLIPLPECDDFPVVVATRLSLSFPILLSAIPLWAIDYLQTRDPARCWFSDGGITSNFPIHFFDAPLPRWPTFGINLGPMPDAERDPKDQSKNLYAPRSNREGIRARWRTINSLPIFMHAIFDTMQNWLDNGQTRVPGFRDRVVTIKHTVEEGGLNLTMPPERIIEFSERGRQAGLWMVRRFSGPASTNEGDKLSWDNHRWVRFRSFNALLDSMFERFLRGYGFDAAPSDRDYPSLMDRPPSYRWCSADQSDGAKGLTAELVAFARLWSDVPTGFTPPSPGCQCDPPVGDDEFDRAQPFHCGAPRPRPVLRVSPDF